MGQGRQRKVTEKVMNSIVVSATVFAVIFAGAVLGMCLRCALPEEQLGPETKDVLRLATGLVVTMTALVLGMLVSTANSSYQNRKNQLSEMASDFVVVDHLLGTYGSETHAIRLEMRNLVQHSLERIWLDETPQSQSTSQGSQLRPTEDSQVFYEKLEALSPKSESQVAIKASAISSSVGLRRTYWLMFLESEQSSLSFPLLVVVVSWLTAIFFSFGLFAPPSRVVIVTLVVCALSVSAAIFIIMAMYTPFRGVMQISPSPIRDALIQMKP